MLKSKILQSIPTYENHMFSSRLWQELSLRPLHNRSRENQLWLDSVYFGVDYRWRTWSRSSYHVGDWGVMQLLTQPWLNLCIYLLNSIAFYLILCSPLTHLLFPSFLPSFLPVFVCLFVSVCLSVCLSLFVCFCFCLCFFPFSFFLQCTFISSFIDSLKFFLYLLVHNSIVKWGTTKFYSTQVTHSLTRSLTHSLTLTLDRLYC